MQKDEQQFKLINLRTYIKHYWKLVIYWYIPLQFVLHFCMQTTICSTFDCNLKLVTIINSSTHTLIHSITHMNIIFNPLNAELNPICHLLALVGSHHILHVSRVRVNYHNVNQQIHTICQNHNHIVVRQLLHISSLTGPSLGSAQLH